MENEKEKYRVTSHKFMGCDRFGKYEWYTYEITLNKPLEHTGRFKDIEDGLNNNEDLTDAYISNVEILKKELMKFKGFKATANKIRELTKELNEIAESIEIIVK